MADSDNSNGFGGLLGGSPGATGGLLGVDPSMLLQLGLGLMSAGAKNSPLRGNWAMGAQQGLQNYQQQRAANQQYQMGKLQIGQLQAELPLYQQAGEILHRLNNDPGTPGLLASVGASQPPQMPQGAPPQPQPGMPSQPSGAPGAPPLPPMTSGAAQPTPPPAAPPAPNRYRPPAPLPTVGGDPMRDVQTGTVFSMFPQFKGISDALINRPKNLQAAQETLVKQRQQEIAEPLSTLDTVAGAANADDIVKNDPELMARWQEVAPRLGLNPQSSLTPDNARAFARFAYNEMASSGQMPAKPMPEIYDTYPGANGQVLQRERSSGKITEPVPQKLPTFTMEKRWNPQTGRDEGVMVQTSPGGSAAPAGILGGNQPRTPSTAPRLAAPGGPATGAPQTAPAAGTPRGGLGQQATAPVDLGFEKPSDDNLKAANFANYARSNIAVLKQMEEAGYRMSPATRAAVINAAVSEDGSALGQLFSQEYLAHRLGPEDTTYMAALMPVLQAAGHSMSGARLTQSQMRTNFESLIPVTLKDPNYISTVAENRQHLYNGLLAQSGSAAQMPEFRSTLGADRAALAASGSKGAPAMGTVSKGYKYVGGDPKLPSSWVKAGG